MTVHVAWKPEKRRVEQLAFRRGSPSLDKAGPDVFASGKGQVGTPVVIVLVMDTTALADALGDLAQDLSAMVARLDRLREAEAGSITITRLRSQVYQTLRKTRELVRAADDLTVAASELIVVDDPHVA